MAGDITFRNLDRDVARAETGCDRGRGMKAWQNEDKDRGGARSQG
jgi:hypothetical protein